MDVVSLQRVCIVNVTRGRPLASRGELADRPWFRLRGLAGRPGLRPEEALLLRPCRGVHTFGMRFAIDAVYLDGVGRVLRIDRALAPRTLAPSCAGAVAVVELPCGAARGTEVGDQIAWAAGTPPQEGQTWQGQPPRR